MADLRWWRIETNAEGKVVSCVAVEHAEKDARCWFYVQAVSDAAAREAARLAHYRGSSMRRRRELIAQGKCGWCGLKGDRGAQRCSKCLLADQGYQQRRRAKDAGKPFVPADKKATLAMNRTLRKVEERKEVIQEAEPSLRLSVLLEVEKAWLDNPRLAGFTQWLQKQIAAARGKKVA